MRYLLILVAALVMAAPAFGQSWMSEVADGGFVVGSLNNTNAAAYFYSESSATSPVLSASRRANIYFDNDRTATDAACTVDLYWCGTSTDIIGSGCNPMGFLLVGGSSVTNTLSGASGANALFEVDVPKYFIVDVTNASGAACQVYVQAPQ